MNIDPSNYHLIDTLSGLQPSAWLNIVVRQRVNVRIAIQFPSGQAKLITRLSIYTKPFPLQHRPLPTTIILPPTIPEQTSP